MTEHEKAIKRLEDATVHEVYGRYQEALDLLSKPYRGGHPQTKQYYLHRRLELTIKLMP